MLIQLEPKSWTPSVNSGGIGESVILECSMRASGHRLLNCAHSSQWMTVHRKRKPSHCLSFASTSCVTSGIGLPPSIFFTTPFGR
eukprot:1215561-Amphidinium_carterae.1